MYMFPGVIEKIFFEIQTCQTEEFEYVKDADYINGLPDYYLTMQENIPVALSTMIGMDIADHGMTSSVHFKTFTPGSVVAFK